MIHWYIWNRVIWYILFSHKKLNPTICNIDRCQEHYGKWNVRQTNTNILSSHLHTESKKYQIHRNKKHSDCQ